MRDVTAAAHEWLEHDPDPGDRAELLALLERSETGDAGAAAELADRFDGMLEFGTAGLRGAMAAGPNRMNTAVVRRAAAGLVQHLLRRIASPLVVVGHDARHRSASFARDTAAVVVAAGGRAVLVPRPLPTPVVAFAVRHAGADAGVVVTASHNPPADNGYKVYLGGPDDAGSQIVPPADADIAAAIAAAPPADEVPLAGDGWDVLRDSVIDAYLDAAAAVATPGGARALSVVLTPMHGVGGDITAEALRRSGFEAPYVVPAQARPDPDFPTVPFPNPEEDGALDLALAAARDRGADLVVANDPDADRCALACPDPSTPGGWRLLTGDETGAVLAEHLAARGLPHGSVLAASLVSSSLVHRIAEHHGLAFASTLTGFKWISRVPGLAFGYEEALGYCCDPASVRDKDGVSAAVLACDLAAALKARGRTLLDALDDLALRHGVHATRPVTLRVEDLALVGAAMARMRSTPPTTLGGAEVTRVEDLGDGLDGLPPTVGLRYRTAHDVRVVVRPSGTEPKLKAYLEAVVPVVGADLTGARATARARLDVVDRDVRALTGL